MAELDAAVRAEVRVAVGQAFARLRDRLLPAISPHAGEPVDAPFRRALDVIGEWVEEESGG